MTERTSLHTESWLPDADVKAVVLIVHGLGEHIGRYAHVAELLVAHGYAVYGIDHLGHGKSTGLRGHVANIQGLVDDLKTYFDTIRAAQVDKPIFIYGHSMGALIGLAFVLRFQGDVAGFVSSGTALNSDEGQPTLLLALVRALNRIAPTLPLMKLAAEHISRDPEQVAAYDSDPLNYRGGTRAGTAISIVKACQAARQELSELRLPLFVIHGGADKITPVSGSQLLYDSAASADKTLKIYPDMYHEPHNSPERDTVLADIAAWLDAHNTSTKAD